jgi:hypothetical protein
MYNKFTQQIVDPAGCVLLEPESFPCSLPPRRVAPAGQRRFTEIGNRGVQMLNDELRKPAGIARLASDLRSAKIELLSAQCATDRLRLQYSVAEIVSFGERQALKGAIASAGALCRFFSAIEDQLKQAEQQE